tara:strand:+ start:11192 stop:11953 length:762 start_codon:yes stop_codon:yes gene_type:complete
MKKIHIIFILIIILFILFKYKKKETFETTDIKIAILIISDKNTKNNRWIYEKEIWKKYMNKYKNIDCFFIECSDNNKINTNEKTINSKCKESLIPGIYQKTLHSLKQLKNKYNYYIRTNLSTFVIFNNLLKQLKKIPNNKYIYTGIINIFSKIKYISGTCIILNNNTVNILLKYGFHKKYYESKTHDDVVIGIVIKDYLGDIINSHNINWRQDISDNKLNLNLTEIPFIRYKDINLKNKKKISSKLLKEIYNV